jgi:hypothetical protein
MSIVDVTRNQRVLHSVGALCYYNLEHLRYDFVILIRINWGTL